MSFNRESIIKYRFSGSPFQVDAYDSTFHNYDLDVVEVIGYRKRVFITRDLHNQLRSCGLNPAEEYKVIHGID